MTRNNDSFSEDKLDMIEKKVESNNDEESHVLIGAIFTLAILIFFAMLIYLAIIRPFLPG